MLFVQGYYLYSACLTDVSCEIIAVIDARLDKWGSDSQVTNYSGE